jgi:SWIB/MDM2 domain/HNH endonuclease
MEKKMRRLKKNNAADLAWMKPVQPDAALAKLVGSKAISRIELTKGIWGYIKQNDLQDKRNLRMINTDKKLQSVCGGKPKVSMFELVKFVESHLRGAKTRPGVRDDDSSNPITDIDLSFPELRTLKNTVRDAVIKSRVGQGPFRARVGRLWNNQCAITGCKITRLLRASHIKPWRYSTNRQRLDPYNGLFLMPNLDAAFDEGYLTFTPKGKLLRSPRLANSDASLLGIKGGLFLRRVPPKMVKYLKYHQRYVFKK